MRLPTNNIAITLVGFAATVLLVPIVLMVIYLVRFARAVRARRGHDTTARQVLSPLEALSETRLL